MHGICLFKNAYTCSQYRKIGVTYFYSLRKNVCSEQYKLYTYDCACKVRLDVHFSLKYVVCRYLYNSLQSSNFFRMLCFKHPRISYNTRPACSIHSKTQCNPLYSQNNILYKPWQNYGQSQIVYVQNRLFSVQSGTGMGSALEMQTGYFKFLSESTPVMYTQDFLLYMHNFSGLPWWTTIVVTTVILRMAVTFPLAIYQNYILAKIENLTYKMPDIVKELKMETAYAIKKFNWSEREARVTYNRSLKKQWNNLIIRDNCHPAKAGIILLAQIPMWICLSVALRNLVYMLPHHDTAAQITCLEMSVGGLLWIPNLVIPDSSWILPVAFGVTNLVIIELQALSRVKERSKFQKYATNFFRGVSVVMIPVAASVPACMSLYWVTSSILGLAQNLTLLSPRVKRLSGIPDTPTMLVNPYRHIAIQIKKRATKLSDWNSRVKT